MRSWADAPDAPRKLRMRSGVEHQIQHNEIVDVFASLWYLWLAHAKERKVNQTTITTDPSFAAIEAIKRNRRRMEVLSQTNDDVNLPAYSAALAAQDNAFDALCCTPPTTIAGARAAIEYVMHVEDMQEVPAARAYLENLLASPLLSPTSSGRQRGRASARKIGTIDGE
jgi:hypothetical protein